MQTEEEMLKDVLREMLGEAKDVLVKLSIIDRWVKIRTIELKQDSGDWGEALSEPPMPLPQVTDANTSRNPERNKHRT